MIEPSSRIGQVLGIDLKKVYKSISAASIRKPDADQINISQFSALIEKVRAAALELPDIRVENVVQAQSDLQAGKQTPATDIASAMLDSSVQNRECDK